MNKLGIVVIKFNHIGCGVGGILINDAWVNLVGVKLEPIFYFVKEPTH